MICVGVVKSGSPTPRLITSGMVAMTSKNFRMPDGGTARTRSDRRWRAAIIGSAVIRLVPRFGCRPSIRSEGGEPGRLQVSPARVGGDGFIGAAQLEQACLVPRAAYELEPDGQP